MPTEFRTRGARGAAACAAACAALLAGPPAAAPLQAQEAQEAREGREVTHGVEASGVPARQASLFHAAGEARAAGVRAAEDGAAQPAAVRRLRLAKWAAAAGTAGAAVAGFTIQRRADDRFEELERACEADVAACSARFEDGRYQDPGLEALYQDVLGLDRRARLALTTSQVGLATTVVLFILDLRDRESPPNIPFEPGRLSVRRGAGGAVEVGVGVGVGR
jgi:hypothetical protein